MKEPKVTFSRLLKERRRLSKRKKPKKPDYTPNTLHHTVMCLESKHAKGYVFLKSKNLVWISLAV